MANTIEIQSPEVSTGYILTYLLDYTTLVVRGVPAMAVTHLDAVLLIGPRAAPPSGPAKQAATSPSQRPSNKLQPVLWGPYCCWLGLGERVFFFFFFPFPPMAVDYRAN